MANIVQIDPTRWEIFFEDLPDWIVPLFKVVPLFYTTNQYQEQWDNLTFNHDFNYFWEKVDNKHYRLYIRLAGSLYLGAPTFAQLPLYVDLSLWAINPNYRNNIQHQVGY